MKQDNKNPVGLFLWLVLSCAIHIVLFRGKLDMNTPVLRRALYAVLAVVVTLPLHEIIHFVLMKLAGLKGVRIRFGKDPLGIPSLCTVFPGEIRGKRRIIILLAPFLLLTLLPDLLFCLNERVHFLFFIMAMCNAAGCYFDVADVVMELRR